MSVPGKAEGERACLLSVRPCSSDRLLPPFLCSEAMGIYLA